MSANSSAVQEQHTPGPWTMIDHPPHKCFYVMAGEGHDLNHPGSGETVAEVRKTRHEQVIANARLIAAAPDMAHALTELVKQWNACGPNSDFGKYFITVREVALVALAKAGL